MSYEIRADYTKRWLLPPSLEDWVGRDHPARFIREFVDALDLQEAGFGVRESVDGRPNYAADHLLKVVVYGYMNRIRSFRKLEAACHEQLGLLWLTGNQAADHNTVWRFWRDNRAALRRCLKLVIRAAVRAKLVGVVLHAVDGTKVLAQASKQTVWTREQVQEGLAQLDAAVEEYMQQAEAAAVEEAGRAGDELPAGWQEQLLRREQLRELAQQLEVEERQSIPEAEREARFMPTRQEGSALAYNAQIVADAHSGLIVAAEVLTEGTDNHALVPMLEQVQENVGAVAQQTVADAGYFSGEQLERAERQGYAVLVPESEEKKAAASAPYSAARFAYDAERDCCICPQGQALTFDGVRTGPRGEALRQYRGRTCAACPVRGACTRERSGRTVRLGPHHQAIRRQRGQRRRAENQAVLRRRKAIVEYPFGLIKWAMEFRRFTVAGAAAVRVQWALICTAFNLRRLHREWVAGRLVFAR